MIQKIVESDSCTVGIIVFWREMSPCEVVVPFCLQNNGFDKSYPRQDHSWGSVYLQGNSEMTSYIMQGQI